MESYLKAYSAARLPDVAAAVTLSAWKHAISLGTWFMPVKSLEIVWTILARCFPHFIPPTTEMLLSGPDVSYREVLRRERQVYMAISVALVGLAAVGL